MTTAKPQLPSERILSPLGMKLDNTSDSWNTYKVERALRATLSYLDEREALVHLIARVPRPLGVIGPYPCPAPASPPGEDPTEIMRGVPCECIAAVTWRQALMDTRSERDTLKARLDDLDECHKQELAEQEGIMSAAYHRCERERDEARAEVDRIHSAIGKRESHGSAQAAASCAIDWIHDAKRAVADCAEELRNIRNLCGGAGCTEPGDDCADPTLAMVEELRQRSVCTEDHGALRVELAEARAALALDRESWERIVAEQGTEIGRLRTENATLQSWREEQQATQLKLEGNLRQPAALTAAERDRYRFKYHAARREVRRLNAVVRLCSLQEIARSEATRELGKAHRAALADKDAGYDQLAQINYKHAVDLQSMTAECLSARTALADEKAAHAETKSALAWERGWDLCRKAQTGAVVEAARFVLRVSAYWGPNCTGSHALSRLRKALSAIDAPQSEPVSNPSAFTPKTPVQVCDLGQRNGEIGSVVTSQGVGGKTLVRFGDDSEYWFDHSDLAETKPEAASEPRAIVVGSTWRHKHSGAERVVDEVWPNAVWLRTGNHWHIDEFRQGNEWVSDPDPSRGDSRKRGGASLASEVSGNSGSGSNNGA